MHTAPDWPARSTQYLKQNFLSNRVFETYTAIVDACRAAWNALMDMPDRQRFNHRTGVGETGQHIARLVLDRAWSTRIVTAAFADGFRPWLAGQSLYLGCGPREKQSGTALPSGADQEAAPWRQVEK
jgi:hypothetical protein